MDRTDAIDPVLACRELDFTQDRLRTLRRFVALSAAEVSLDPGRIDDLVLAVNELATNSVRHAGGAGTLRMWREGNVLLCDVHDQGQIPQPSLCPTAPEPTQITGRGLWIVSQLCDLVQIRSSQRGSVVRVHMRLT
jgi:anti-sigma regulatory factor (Ser/Thr protein kinase)